MLYRNVPSNGDSLSILGYGCMRLPTRAGLIDEPRAASQLRSAIDRGVNYVDTAMPYHGGMSETFLGKTGLGDGYRDKVKLTTKLPQWQVRTREDMDSLLNKQLKKLKTDRLDYYLIHAVDGPAWLRLKQLGIQDFLDRARQDGRILSTGFSYHGIQNDFNGLVDDYPWDMCQIQYNILDEKNQAGKAGLEYAASKNLAVIIMEPLRGGQLVNKIPRRAQELWDGLPEKKSPADWALRWIWNHPQVTCILSGMNEEAHIDENIRIAGEALANSLDPAVLETAGKVKEVYADLMKVGCTGCRYCLPCPAGINIPFVFEQYNNLHMFENRMETRFLYASRAGGIMSGKTSWASSCLKCGKCESHCPQSLPVRNLMDEVSRTMEGPVIKTLMGAGRLFLGHKKNRDQKQP